MFVTDAKLPHQCFSACANGRSTLCHGGAFLLASSLDFKFYRLLVFALINSLLHEKQDSRPDAYCSDKRKPYVRQLKILTKLVVRQHCDCVATSKVTSCTENNIEDMLLNKRQRLCHSPGATSIDNFMAAHFERLDGDQMSNER